MIANRIGIVLCRVGAAVLIVQAVRSLGYTIPGLYTSFGDFGANALLFLLMTFVPSLAAIGLWVFADRICATPNYVDTDSEAEPIRSIDFVLIGTALIGLYLVISGIIQGLNIEVAQWFKSNLGDEFKAMLDQERARVIAIRVSYVAQIALGTILIVGKSQISRFLLRVRYIGTGTS